VRHDMQSVNAGGLADVAVPNAAAGR
jgi:hypothetical protein